MELGDSGSVGAPAAVGGEGARREVSSLSFARRSSSDWMVDSPRWSVGSSSESEPDVPRVVVEGFPVLASFRISSSADLASGGPEYFRGAKDCMLGREERLLGLSLWMSSAAPIFAGASSFCSSGSAGVGIGGPRPPVGSGVSIHAPVTSGVFRLMLSMFGCGVLSTKVWSIHAPVTSGVLRLLEDFAFCGV